MDLKVKCVGLLSYGQSGLREKSDLSLYTAEPIGI